MGVIGKPQPQTTGRLWWSAWYLQSFENRLRELADDITGKFIVGTYLAVPFYVLASYIDGVVSFMYKADDDVQEFIAWVEHIINGEGFIELLHWASYNFYYIRNNPKGWFSYILSQFTWKLALLLSDPWSFVNMMVRELSSSIGLLLDNPLTFIHNYLLQLRWFIGTFLDNPSLFVKYFFRQIGWWFAYLIDNPLHFVNGLVRQLSPNIGHLIDDARGWLWNRIYDLSYDLASFVHNPKYYLERQIADILGLPQGFWSYPLYYILEALFRELKVQLRNFSRTIVDLAIDIILDFM